MRLGHSKYPKVGIAPAHKEDIAKWRLEDEDEFDDDESELGPSENMYYEDDPNVYSYPHRVLR